ncbi:MAG: Mov34/MPN/PAD-1 family protein [Candidatus Latescibacterota bacterium]|nr:MAG: Mov34/MPN/PAD-1 family protein [Candidatus Latescibacterota bacterium]
MVTNRYKYAIEMYRDDGTNLGQVPVEMDPQPALEWTWLTGLRRNKLELSDGTGSSAVLPVWHREVGEPYIEGFRVTILSDEDDGITEDFSTLYFKREADQARLNLIASKRLRKDETVRYVTLAFLNDAHAMPAARPQFKTREAPPDIRIVESDFGSFVNRSQLEGEVTTEDIPIVIPRRILDETRELALASRDKETGGVLIGHLHRDRTVPEVFVEVTAQIKAAHAVADAARLTFTPDTWSAVQAAVDLRGEGETWVAWWHSHVPVGVSCKDCPEEKRAVCPLVNGFFSQDDRQLHRTVFFKAFASALTLSLKDEGDGSEITHKLYGWRHGVIEPRGFYVLNNGLSTSGGERHAERQP